MAPKSILKKRAAPVADDVIEEVPASGPSAERLVEPESESESEEEEDDSDAGESFDETDDEEDEEAIREMGEGRQKGPKSALARCAVRRS